MSAANDERKAAVAAARAEREAKKAATVKQRKAAIGALRAWADLARSKKAVREAEAAERASETVAAAEQRSVPRPAVKKTTPPPPQPTDAPPNELLELLGTYRELAVTKAKLSVLSKVDELQRSANTAVDNARRQLPGGGA
eukprot:447074-Prymnesium_polylepis.1